MLSTTDEKEIKHSKKSNQEQESNCDEGEEVIVEEEGSNNKRRALTPQEDSNDISDDEMNSRSSKADALSPSRSSSISKSPSPLSSAGMELDEKAQAFLNQKVSESVTETIS